MIRGEDIPVLDEMFDSRKTFFYSSLSKKL